MAMFMRGGPSGLAALMRRAPMMAPTDANMGGPPGPAAMGQMPGPAGAPGPPVGGLGQLMRLRELLRQRALQRQRQAMAMQAAQGRAPMVARGPGPVGY